ncbi:MAG: glycoside hydrolase [Spirochaetales bacterium]
MKTKLTALIAIICIAFASCTESDDGQFTVNPSTSVFENILYYVNPLNSELVISVGDNDIIASHGGLKADNFREQEGITSWNYIDNDIDISIEQIQDYLSVTVISTSAKDNEISFPCINAEKYYMPLGEGKSFGANDPVWVEYLSGSEADVQESFSMPFFSTVHKDNALVYILEDAYRNTIVYDNNDTVGFSVLQKFVEIDEDKEKNIRIYVTENNPASIAKIYRDYIIETDNFVTLAEKAEQNPNIKKLYGAPHIYYASSYIISSDNIQWQSFINSIESPVMQYLFSFADKIEVGKEVSEIIGNLKSQGYVDNYQQNVICRYITDVLMMNDFYRDDIFIHTGIISEDYNNKTHEAAHITLNKNALATSLSAVFSPANTWTDSKTVAVLTDMKKNGIDTAWIGLHSWEQAYMKPEFANLANELGYLVAPYDSYHSIHKKGEEQWITAKFKDENLYHTATIKNIHGDYITGFQNIGRKLNPGLTLDIVDDRVNTVTSAENNFNSWFIDCDATGEIYDDYNSNTTMREDLQGRLERMALIRDKYNMVIGSEGGNDYAATTIAFAHGIELPAFTWMDSDMRFNRESEYYQGTYYNPTGGVTPNFSKRIPLKDYLYNLFLNPAYDIPLFKLVYNDSVITTYHWGWSTFKLKGLTADRMLREILYNVPAIYHLDDVEWGIYKNDIIAHNTVWSDFSKQVINQEMTDFKNLTADGKVKMTQYGKNIRVIANFGDTPYIFENIEIASHSLIIENNGNIIYYTPNITETNR